MNVIIGRYVPGESLIHKLDPRAKLISIFFYVMIVFLANNEVTYALLCAYVLVAILASGVPIRFILNGLKPVMLLILFTLLLHVFTTRGGMVLFEFGWLSIHTEGIRQGVFVALRFLLLISMASLLTLTTTPIEITDGLESVMGPLNAIRVPVHEIALMLSIALRFIPTLVQETDKIMKAQSARGVDFSSGTMKERVQSIVSLMVPLFVGSFKRAEELAIAMEARGYRGGNGRTKFRDLRWQGRDTLVLVSLVCLAIVLFLVRA